MSSPLRWWSLSWRFSPLHRGVGQFLKRHPDRGLNPGLVTTFNNRLHAYWLLCAVLAAAFSRRLRVYVLRCLASCRFGRYASSSHSRRRVLGDHRALFWVFFVITPLQYVLVAFNQYELFNVLIPVYAFLFVSGPRGDCGRL